MSKTTRQLAGRIQADQLQAMAAEGVQRALAVRARELSAEQVQEVSGGLSVAMAAFDDYDWCGTVPKKIPFRPGTIFTGGVPVIINGRYGDLNVPKSVLTAGF
jgi:hypothetical protein